MLYSLTLCDNICFVWLCLSMWTWVCVEEVDIWVSSSVFSTLFFRQSFNWTWSSSIWLYSCQQAPWIQTRVLMFVWQALYQLSCLPSLEVWQSLDAQTSISLTPVLLPQSPKCWECQHEPPDPHSSMLIFYSSSLSQYRVSVCFFNY